MSTENVCIRESLLEQKSSGTMGVPISFLDKFCPEQFEIIGCSDNGNVADEFKLKHFKRHNEPYIDGKKIYKRIFIKFKENN